MLVRLTVDPKIKDHFDGQAESRSILRKAGVTKLKWIMGSNTAHTWKGYVHSAEQVTALGLICEKIEFDPTIAALAAKEVLQERILLEQKEIDALTQELGDWVDEEFLASIIAQ